VVIDEFQHLIEVGGETVERQLRATIQRQSRVSYVFAGSKTALPDDMTLSPARPFYRLGARLFLGPIPRKDFAEAVRQGFARARFSVDADALERLFELAEDVPYNVQALASMSWEIVRGQDGEGRLTLGGLERALDQLISQDSPFYSKLWNLCTQPQQRALTAVAVMRGKGHCSRESSSRIRFRARFSPVSSAINSIATHSQGVWGSLCLRR
jgi:hypothetical protein